MCSSLVLLHALSVFGMLAAFIAAAIYEVKLTSRFRQKHAEVWAELCQRKVMFSDGDESPNAAMHWYLLCGEHKKLQDAKLNSMVLRSRLLIGLIFCSAVALMFVQDQASINNYRACLGFP
jgi:hypothetical protein